MSDFLIYRHKDEPTALNHLATLGFVRRVDDSLKFMKLEIEGGIQHLHYATISVDFDDLHVIMIETQSFKTEL